MNAQHTKQLKNRNCELKERDKRSKIEREKKDKKKNQRKKKQNDC